jgi:trehalose 6-phosphate synthase
MLHAIKMPKRERATRMRALRRRVLTHDVQRWSATFLDALVRADHNDPANLADIPKRPLAAPDYSS